MMDSNDDIRSKCVALEVENEKLKQEIVLLKKTLDHLNNFSLCGDPLERANGILNHLSYIQ